MGQELGDRGRSVLEPFPAERADQVGEEGDVLLLLLEQPDQQARAVAIHVARDQRLERQAALGFAPLDDRLDLFLDPGQALGRAGGRRCPGFRAAGRRLVAGRRRRGEGGLGFVHQIEQGLDTGLALAVAPVPLLEEDRVAVGMHEDVLRGDDLAVDARGPAARRSPRSCPRA